MCDLVGSTARHARIGEDAADQFRSRFFDALRGAVAANHGEVIKNLGDGLLVVFRSSTVDALHCAHDLHDAVSSLDGDDPVLLRVGVSAGEAAEEDGDWFGMPVIEASRLCAEAAPATTVTTGIVRALAGSRGSHHFTALGSRELKGIPNPVDLWRVDREQPLASAPTTARSQRSTRRFALPATAAALAVIALVWVAISTGADDDARVGSTAEGNSQPATDTAPDTDASTTPTPSTGPTTTTVSVPATVTAPTGYTPLLSDRDCATDPVVEGIVGIECWTLTVPENRSLPQRVIELHGYLIPATANPEAAPTIIDLGPSMGLANGMASVANTVIVPSRGFGLSTQAFDCAEVDQVIIDGLAKPSNDAGVAAAALSAVGACHDRLIAAGFDLASYNAEAEIGDVTDYLVAAGLDHAFITANRSDAPAALIAADRFPGTFQGVFLENPIDPGSSWRADPVDDAAAAFSRYAALCAADPGCAGAFPNLATAVADAYLRIEAAPRTLDATVRVVHLRQIPPQAPRDVKVYYDGDRASASVVAALQVSVIHRFLAKSLVGAAETAQPAGDESTAGVAAGVELGAYQTNTAAYLSYQCAALPRLASLAPTSAVLIPEFAGAYDERFLDWCEVWDVPRLPPEFTAPSQGATPTLIAVGALDPSPAALYAEGLQRARSNTTVITFATMGSAIYLLGPPCYRDLVIAFVADPNGELAVDECAAQSPPIDFIL